MVLHGEPRPAGLRRWRVVLLLGLVAALLLLGIAWLRSERLSEPADGLVWRPAFAAAMHGPLDDGGPPYDDRSLRFADVSLRQFVPLALPGHVVRLRLSNQFGNGPLQIGEVRLAWRAPAGGAAIRSASTRPVSFDGKPGVLVPQGQTVTSDAVEMPATAEPADLAISLYLPQPTPRASWHLVGSRSSYRSVAGNHVAADVLPYSRHGRSLLFVAGVDVLVDEDAGLWVAFGDSITDGNGHSLDQDASWPARVNQGWRTSRPGAPVGMLNAGMSGNRLLSDEVGPSGLQRFERDVLAIDGVRGVVILLGINDLAGTVQPDRISATVQGLIDAHTELTRRAHGRGLRVVGATLTPAQGGVYGRPEVEAGRQQFNRWIRAAGVFDRVVDLDAAIRDPAAPDRIRDGLTGDGLHPNDEGYRVIADTVSKALAEVGR